MCRQEVVLRADGSKRVISHFDGPSLTRQEFKDECDLGKIIARFSATPEGLEALQKARGFVESRFEDVSEVIDFRSAMETVRRADEAFLRLPPAVRTRFDNDPAAFLDFVDNPANVDELRKLGLLKPKVERPVEAADAAKPAAG